MSNIWTILCIIIMIIFIIIMCLTIRFYFLNVKYYKYHDRYLQTHFYVKKTENKGRGVFANQDYKKGEIIEICPCIKEKLTSYSPLLKNYVFSLDDDYGLIGLGYCSIYNDSKTPNAFWEVMDESSMRVIALKNIKKGEEICHSYGTDYWDSRQSDIEFL